MVKKLDNNSKNYILYIFNKFFVDGSFLAELQHSVVIPIRKPGKDHPKSDSYRPIAFYKLPLQIVGKNNK